jgi:hypothetical protein
LRDVHTEHHPRSRMASVGKAAEREATAVARGPRARRVRKVARRQGD